MSPNLTTFASHLSSLNNYSDVPHCIPILSISDSSEDLYKGNIVLAYDIDHKSNGWYLINNKINCEIEEKNNSLNQSLMNSIKTVMCERVNFNEVWKFKHYLTINPSTQPYLSTLQTLYNTVVNFNDESSISYAYRFQDVIDGYLYN
ncbi:unnamed protein product [Schistosoma bovis]|nr:unnamed protein product [Schistosoma bovis]